MYLAADDDRLLWVDESPVESNPGPVLDQESAVGRIQVAKVDSAVDDPQYGVLLARRRRVDVDMPFAADDKGSTLDKFEVQIRFIVFHDCLANRLLSPGATPDGAFRRRIRGCRVKLD
jgi:hypothetical protein